MSGYEIREDRIEDGGKKPIRRVTGWRPYEVSSVAIGLDETVGIGRRNYQPNKIRKQPMTEQNRETISQKQLDHEVRESAKREKARCEEIRRLGDKFGFPSEAERAIASDINVEEFRRSLTESWEPPSAELDVATYAHTRSYSGAGSTFNIRNAKAEQYSLTRAISQAADGKLSGVELELSQEIATRTGKPASGFYVPSGVLGQGRRDMTVGNDTAGGYLSDEYNAGYIDRLTNRALAGLARGPR